MGIGERVRGTRLVDDAVEEREHVAQVVHGEEGVEQLALPRVLRTWSTTSMDVNGQGGEAKYSPIVDTRALRPNMILFKLVTLSTLIKACSGDHSKAGTYARNSGTSWNMFSSLMTMVCNALGSEMYRMGAYCIERVTLQSKGSHQARSLAYVEESVKLCNGSVVASDVVLERGAIAGKELLEVTCAYSQQRVYHRRQERTRLTRPKGGRRRTRDTP